MSCKSLNYIYKIGVLLFLLCLGVSLMAQINNKPMDITFDSEGFKIAGKFYQASGDGIKPTAILLHGIPGGDGDLFDLGQKLSTEGINVLVFNYRGTWKSEGVYLPSTSLEDINSAIKFLKSSQTAATFSIDTTRLYIVGYSYGGGMALLGSLFDDNIKKVVSIAGGSLKVVADNIEKSDEYRQMHRQYLDDCMADSNAVRGLGGKESHEWLLPRKDKFDIVQHAEKLSAKKVLWIGGWRDYAIPLEEHILPLFRAIQRFSMMDVKIQVYDCNHSFEGFREHLADDIVSWLRE